MSEIFDWLLDSNFSVRSEDWTSDLLRLHVWSEIITALTYLLIAGLLVYYTVKKRLKYCFMYFFFASFIIADGTTHAINLLTLFLPCYRLDGVLRAICAVLSLTTLLIFGMSIPKIIARKSETQLEEELDSQIQIIKDTDRKQKELTKKTTSLQSEVQARNAALSQSNSLLLNANNNKDLFFMMLSHELRNPLAPLKTTLHILEKNTTDSKLKNSIQMAFRCTNQLSRIVEDLTAVQLIGQGKLSIQKKNTTVQKIIRAVAENQSACAELKNIHFIMDMPKDEIKIFADPDRLIQALSHVVGNAIKFSHAGGHVMVKVSGFETFFEISVVDNGIGIPNKILGSVFEPYIQEDQSISRSYGGIGVGLTITKYLIEAHQGTIDIHSSGKNRGTTARMSIPAQKENAHAINENKMGSVLIIDQDHLTSHNLALCLRLFAVTVLQPVNNETDALQQIESEKPSVVLVDTAKPQWSTEIAAKIKKQWRNVIVILMTNCGEELPDMTPNFDANILKPVDPKELIRQIKGLTRG